LVIVELTDQECVMCAGLCTVLEAINGSLVIVIIVFTLQYVRYMSNQNLYGFVDFHVSPGAIDMRSIILFYISIIILLIKRGYDLNKLLFIFFSSLYHG